MRTRIKICGITRIEDARTAVDCGADAIGFIFFPRSKRSISIEQAISIQREMPAIFNIVGVFVNPSEDYVTTVIKKVHLSVLQFHGKESDNWCCQFGKPFIKSIPVSEHNDPMEMISEYPNAAAFLLDTYDPVKIGGTGESFDWDRIPSDVSAPVILAGGLNPSNIKRAIVRSPIWGVDVSSGVEISPGIKSAKKISEFCTAVTAIDCSKNGDTYELV